LPLIVYNVSQRKQEDLANIMQTLTQTQQNVLNAIQAILDNPSNATIEKQAARLTQEERDKLLEIASLVTASRQ